MKKKRAAASPPPRTSATVWERLTAALLAIGILVIPTIYSYTFHQPYRLPKMLLLRAFGAVLVLVLAWVFAQGRIRLSGRARLLHTLLGVGLGWSLLSAAGAASKAPAVGAVITLAAAAAFFAAAHAVGRALPLTFLSMLFIAAIVQTVFAVAQNAGFWFPLVDSFARGAMQDPFTLRVAPLGTLGNRNDVGMFIAAPLLAAITVAVVSRRRRAVASMVAATLALGLLASKTLTAVAAVVVAVAVLALLRSRKAGMIALAAATLLLVSAVALYAPLRTRVSGMAGAAARGNLDAIITNRGAAYLAASSMFLDNPVLGVGAGNFAVSYFDHRLRSFQRWPTAAALARSEDNFGEAHNDHLQTLAEYGLPGYLLLVFIAIIYARTSLRRRDGSSDEREDFARTFALPHAVLIVVLALAQFPMQIAATLLTTAVLAGLTTAWESIDA